jgi:hypothetical protein
MHCIATRFLALTPTVTDAKLHKRAVSTAYADIGELLSPDWVADWTAGEELFMLSVLVYKDELEI